MSKKNEVSQLATKIEKLQKSLDSLKTESNKELVSVLNTMIALMSEFVVELDNQKEHALDIESGCGVLEERIEEIECYLDESDLYGENSGNIINCPFCDAEVEIDEEFLTDEDPKLICKNCNKEIEVLSHSCSCGCEDGCEDDCECDCENGCDFDEDCGCHGEGKELK